MRYAALRCMIVADAYRVLSVNGLQEKPFQSYLVVGEDEGVGDNNILRASSCEHDDLGDVIGGERSASAKRELVSVLATRSVIGAVLTHIRHWPWTCHRRIGPRRIPVEDDVRRGSCTDPGVFMGISEMVRHVRRELTVSTCPGSTEMTRTRDAISSFRKLSVKLLTAALDAQ